MARPLRICLPNLTYHVYSRCIEKKPLLNLNSYKDLFISILNNALERYSFEVISYTIMDNHIHLVIRTIENGETISRIMQYIKARFAEKYNRLTNRCGPFWNERFKDTIIEFVKDPQKYFLLLIWYLGYNPVRYKKVQDPRDYDYGTINVYLSSNYSPPIRITLSHFFITLGSTFEKQTSIFKQYEEINHTMIPGHISKNYLY